MQLSGEEGRERRKQKCKNILCLDLNFHLSVQAGQQEKQIDTWRRFCRYIWTNIWT
jgi:hypothetical protein